MQEIGIPNKIFPNDDGKPGLNGIIDEVSKRLLARWERQTGLFKEKMAVLLRDEPII